MLQGKGEEETRKGEAKILKPFRDADGASFQVDHDKPRPGRWCISLRQYR
jgi:hypothetical protein